MMNVIIIFRQTVSYTCFVLIRKLLVRMCIIYDASNEVTLIKSH